MNWIGRTLRLSVAGAALLSLTIACGSPTHPHQRDDPKDNPSEDDGQAMIAPAPEHRIAAPSGLHILDPSLGLA